MVYKLGVVSEDAVSKRAEATLADLSSHDITALLGTGAFYQEDAVYPAMAALEKGGKLNVRISAAVVSLPHAGRFDLTVTTFVGEERRAERQFDGVFATGAVDVPAPAIE